MDDHSLTIEDFSFLISSWDGSLEYLNYGDDETLVTLPTRAVYSQSEDKISYHFVYTEPNGSEVKGQGDIEIKLTRRGLDNDRDAQIDHVMQRKGDVVSITWFILLDGAEDSFVRHTYTFNLEE